MMLSIYIYLYGEREVICELKMGLLSMAIGQVLFPLDGGDPYW